MEIRVIGEYGYAQALLGLGLSHGLTSGYSLLQFVRDRQLFGRVAKIAEKLYCRDGGHNKFLESIVVYIDLYAPRYFHQQLDTYRVGITKQSESTMHTLLRDVLTQYDFAKPIPQDFLWQLNNYIEHNQLHTAKAMLPEGFLQRRIVCTNYQTLRRIIKQRRDHKLSEWQRFITAVLEQIEHREFFEDLEAARG